MTRLNAALLSLTLWLFLCQALRAQTLLVDSSRILNASQVGRVDVVDGVNAPTVLEITPGDPPYFVGDSTIRVYDTSVVNLVAGLYDSFLQGYDSSTVNFYGTLYCRTTVIASDSATLNFLDTVMYGSSAVQAYDSSVINVSGGEVSTSYAYGSATVNVGDGRVAGLHARDTSSVNIRGGLVGTLTGYGLSAANSSTMHIFGIEFNYPPGPIPDTDATLIGTLADGSPINTNLFINGNDASIILHYVPEPSALWLAFMGCLGMLAYRMRRRGSAA